MEEFRYKLRLVAFCVRLILLSRVVNSELLHRNTIFDKVIQVVSHWVRLYFVVVQFEFLTIYLVPLVCVYDNIFDREDTVGHIINMIVFFNKPFDSLCMRDLSLVMFFSHIFNHV